MIVQNLCWLFRQDLLDCACYPTRRPPGSQSPTEKSTLSTFRIGFQQNQAPVTNWVQCNAVKLNPKDSGKAMKLEIKDKCNFLCTSLMTNSDNRWVLWDYAPSHVDSVACKKCPVTITLLGIHCPPLHWNTVCSAHCTVYSVHMPVLQYHIVVVE